MSQLYVYFPFFLFSSQCEIFPIEATKKGQQTRNKTKRKIFPSQLREQMLTQKRTVSERVALTYFILSWYLYKILVRAQHAYHRCAFVHVWTRTIEASAETKQQHYRLNCGGRLDSCTLALALARPTWQGTILIGNCSPEHCYAFLFSLSIYFVLSLSISLSVCWQAYNVHKRELCKWCLRLCQSIEWVLLWRLVAAERVAWFYEVIERQWYERNVNRRRALPH